MRGYPKDATGSTSDNRDGDQVVRDQFSRRLYKALIDKGWTQAELARRVSFNRAAISSYITARSLPTPSNLAKLAKVLDMAPEELLPPVGEVMADMAAPLDACSFKEVGDGQVRLQVNKIVSMEAALEVLGVVNRDRAKAAN